MDCWLPKIRSGLAQLPRWATLIAGMIDLFKLLGGLLVGVFRSHAAREAEMAFLRQQLLVLQRSAPARLRLRTADRLISVWLYRLFPCLLEAAVVFKPARSTRILRSIDLRRQSGVSHQSLGSAVSIGTTFGWHNR